MMGPEAGEDDPRNWNVDNAESFARVLDAFKRANRPEPPQDLHDANTPTDSRGSEDAPKFGSSHEENWWEYDPTSYVDPDDHRGRV